MQLDMPSPAEAETLRTILLVVLGVMIVTIPIVCLLVVSKVLAQRRQFPKNQVASPGPPSSSSEPSSPSSGAEAIPPSTEGSASPQDPGRSS